MIELDFIPEWYRAAKNRKRRYHRQHALLGLLLALLVGWNFILGRWVNHTSAEAAAMQELIESAQHRVTEAVTLQNEISDICRKATELETIGSRTKTTAILGELSYLAGENIILSRLTLSAEPVRTLAPEQAPTPKAVVQISQPKGSDETPVPTRTKVIISGIAASAADAATLIYRLEQSNYFKQAAPVFTRAKNIKDNEVTEFEIRCYVDDYRLE